MVWLQRHWLWRALHKMMKGVRQKACELPENPSYTFYGSSEVLMYNRLEILLFLLGTANALFITRLMNRRVRIIRRFRQESQQPQALVLLSELNFISLWMIMSVLFLVVAFALGVMTVMIEYEWLALE